MARWARGLLMALMIALGGCAPGGAGDALVVGADESGESSEGTAGDGVLVLVSAGVDSLTLRWVEDFAPDAAGFRLRWRVVPASGGEELAWSSVDVDGTVREYTVGGLEVGATYRLRLNALNADGDEGASAVAAFATLAPGPGNLTGSSTELDAVALSWDAPTGWTAAGFVVRWKVRGADDFSGEAPLGSEGRSYVIEGLAPGAYSARVTALTGEGRESDPATLDVVVGGGDGVLGLVEASVDSLVVRWNGRFEPDAAGFRLRWRVIPAVGGEELMWSSVDVDGAVREYAIEGLEVGTPYRLRLNALGADGGEGALAVATFATLATPPQNLAAVALGHDAVELSWESPAEWAPVGYTLQWRHRGRTTFLGSLELPPGRRRQTVTGLTGGGDYVFRLTAHTAGGHRSDPASSPADTPSAPANDLTLQISVPTYCIAGEGTTTGQIRETIGLDNIYQREGVASVSLQWRVTGGAAPYTLQFLGAEHHGAAGTAEVSCAIEGIDLSDLPQPGISVVESGPKTFTVTVADATGATITKTVTIEIIEVATGKRFWLDGGILEPGYTYYVSGLFYESPEGSRIGIIGGVSGYTGGYYFEFGDGSHPTRMPSLMVHEITGEERSWGSRLVYRHDENNDVYDDGIPYSTLTDAENERWDRFLAGIRITPFPEGDPRNDPPAPLAPNGAAAATQGAPTPGVQCTAESSDGDDVLLDFHGKRWSTRWRPYGTQAGATPGRHALPCLANVGVHSSLLAGESITVCIHGSPDDDLLLPALRTAVHDWNQRLAPRYNHPDPSLREGLGYPAFVIGSTCSGSISATDTSLVRVSDLRGRCRRPGGIPPVINNPCPSGSDLAGAIADPSVEPPHRIGGNRLHIYATKAGVDVETDLAHSLRHELGHFLGLADYKFGCWRLADSAGIVQPSAMSYGGLSDRRLLDNEGTVLHTPASSDETANRCESDTVTDRDLTDLHTIYHPRPVTNPRLREEPPSPLGPGRAFWVLTWQPPAGGTPLEVNAERIGVARRALATRDPATCAPTNTPAWELIYHKELSYNDRLPSWSSYTFPLGTEVAGYEYAVVGLTRGDAQRGEIAADGPELAHAVLTSPGERSWTAGGASETVATPPLITIAAATTPVTESLPVVFTVTRAGFLDTPLTVNLTVSESGDMISGTAPNSVTFDHGACTATFSVATLGDNTAEKDSIVTVVVEDGDGYVMDPAGIGGSASVIVVDDDASPVVLPLVYFSGASALGGVGGSVVLIEGASADFAVSRSGATASPLSVNVDVAASGGVVDSADLGSRLVTIPAGAESVVVSVATVDDSAAGDYGVVEVVIVDGPGYRVGSWGPASAVVYDNDRTPGEVAVWPVAQVLGEGDGFVDFTVVGSGAATSAVTVELNVSETGDVVSAASEGSRSVTIPAGAHSVGFSVGLVDDATTGSNSAVTVAVSGGAGYAIGSPGAATVGVVENDHPSVGVWAVASPVREGASALFTVGSAFLSARSVPWSVNLRVTETGDMVAAGDLGSASVTIPAGATSATFAVGTEQDATAEDDSIITVSITGGEDYRSHPAGYDMFAAVTVHDDENPQPRVSITPGGDVVEGSAAGFTVSRGGPTTAPLTVALNITETGATLAPPTPTSITIPAGAASNMLSVATTDDAAAEDDSAVTATLTAGAGYTINSPRAATVHVADNDSTLPKLSIHPFSGDETEGAPLLFTITRSGSRIEALTVNVTVTETGATVAAPTPTTLTIPAGADQLFLIVATTDDTTAEDDSTITATITRPPNTNNYTTGTPNTTTATIRDNDL